MIASFDEIDDDGSFTGSIHRAWMDVKAFFSGNNDESMPEEAIRGDKAAAEEYVEVPKEELLPLKVGTIIRNQLLKIKADLNQIKSLEDLKE